METIKKVSKRARHIIALVGTGVSASLFTLGAYLYGTSPRVIQQASICGVTCAQYTVRHVELSPGGIAAFVGGGVTALASLLIALSTCD